MTIKIQGTNSTAAPGITGGDTDTGVKFGTNEVTIVTNGTDRFKIGSDGAINTNMQCHGHIELDSTGSFTTPAVKLFADTGEIRVKSGGGINFDAYATSGNPSTNLLDDYEEGSWTPTVDSGGSGIGLDTNDCKYVKVGNLVTCTYEMGAVTSATGSDLVFGGLPFTPNNEGSFSLAITGASFGSGITFLTGHINSSGAWSYFKGGSGASWSRLKGNEFGSASTFGTIVYRAS